MLEMGVKNGQKCVKMCENVKMGDPVAMKNGQFS